MAKRVTVHSSISTMEPWPQDKIRLVCGIVLQKRIVHPERSPEVLSIKPPADQQHRMIDILQVLRNVSRLPVFVIGAMDHVVIPRRNVISEKLSGVCGGTHPEEEVISIRSSVIERTDWLVCWGRTRAGVTGHP